MPCLRSSAQGGSQGPRAQAHAHTRKVQRAHTLAWVGDTHTHRDAGRYGCRWLGTRPGANHGPHPRNAVKSRAKHGNSAEGTEYAGRGGQTSPQRRPNRSGRIETVESMDTGLGQRRRDCPCRRYANQAVRTRVMVLKHGRAGRGTLPRGHRAGRQPRVPITPARLLRWGGMRCGWPAGWYPLCRRCDLIGRRLADGRGHGTIPAMPKPNEGTERGGRRYGSRTSRCAAHAPTAPSRRANSPLPCLVTP